jgi:chorismate mutase
VNDPILDELRARIDELDASLLELLRERFDVTEKVGRHKKDVGMPPADPNREKVQIARLRQMAADLGLDPTFSEKLLRVIIDEVIRDYARKGGPTA